MKDQAKRNPDLDRIVPEDVKIGDLQSDESGQYRMVNGKRIGQMEEKTQRDKDLNLIINRVRASGLRPSEYADLCYSRNKK